MVKRYQVRWKHGGKTTKLELIQSEFFTFRGAMKRVSMLNLIGSCAVGRPADLWIAVVWDVKENKQVSTKLY